MRRTRGRTLRAGVALSALAIVLTACGGSDSSTPTGDSSGDARERVVGPRRRRTRAQVIWADNSANTANAIEPLCPPGPRRTACAAGSQVQRRRRSQIC